MGSSRPHSVSVQPSPGARRPLTRARSHSSTTSSALSPWVMASKPRRMSRARSALSRPVQVAASSARRAERRGEEVSPAWMPSHMYWAAWSRSRAEGSGVRAASASTVRTASSNWSLWSRAWDSRKTASTRCSPSSPGMASAVRRWPMVVEGAVRRVAQPSSNSTRAWDSGNGGSCSARSRQRRAASGAPTARCSRAASRNWATTS